MGTIADKLAETKRLITEIAENVSTIEYGGKTYASKFENLTAINDVVAKYYKYDLNAASAIENGKILSGYYYYDLNGRTFFKHKGTFKPYDGATVVASDILSGKKAYDANGALLTGTYESSGSTSTKPYKITVNNNNSSLKIVKGFSGSNNNLVPSYCEYGESYDIYVDLGDVVSFMFYNSLPRSETISAPLERLYPNESISALIKGKLTGAVVNNIPSWRPGETIAVATYLFYYGANNTSITFN